MATSLTDFKSALVFGGARPSLFSFEVSGAPNGVSATLGNVQFYCSVSEIPPITLTPIERQYFGRTVKIPGDLVFGDLTTTIINTEDFGVRNEIEKWMEVINSSVKNEGKSGTVANDSLENISGTAKLTHFQKNGDKTMTYEFVNIWPTSLTEIALSYDTASDIEQFDCTWAYQYFKTPENDQGSVVTQNPTQD